MIYENTVLVDISNKKMKYNRKYSDWYYKLSHECEKRDIKHTNLETLQNKSRRIDRCMSYFLWDKYEVNKILDLKSVNRCMNNRFCPNCRKVDMIKYIRKVKNMLEKYIDMGYIPMMLTLTLPNVSGSDLENTLKLMSNKFRRLNDIMMGKRKTFRMPFTAVGGIRVLECQPSKQYDLYHPHYHCLVFVKNENLECFDKNICGRFSKKRQATNMKSVADAYISYCWTQLLLNQRITQKGLENNNIFDSYECDMQFLDKFGVYEIFKYTFKDATIKDLHDFEILETSLINKRLRQGFGCLYNEQFEDIEDGTQQELELIYQENPVEVLTKEIIDILTNYADYKKISRFRPDCDKEIWEKLE